MGNAAGYGSSVRHGNHDVYREPLTRGTRWCGACPKRRTSERPRVDLESVCGQVMRHRSGQLRHGTVWQRGIITRRP
jgi:hypothetical protein